MSNVLSRFRSISEMEFYKNAVELRCALSGFVMQEKYIPKKWRHPQRVLSFWDCRAWQKAGHPQPALL